MSKRLTEVRILWKGEIVHVRTAAHRGAFEMPALGNDVAYEVVDVDVEPIDRGPIVERASVVANALSLLAHVGVLVAVAFTAPRFADDDSVAVHCERVLVMKRLLDARDEHIITPLRDDMRDDSGNTEGGTGSAAKREDGAMGSRAAAPAFARFGIEGFKDDASPSAAREDALAEAAMFGIIGLLPSGDASAPATTWGRVAHGNEATSAHGNMWGDAVADAGGQSGLGLTGTGEGGGCACGDGIGIGTIGTIGHGLGHGIGGGVGAGHGHLDGGHTPGPPSIRSGATSINGRLPPETIQRVVRENFGRFRACYADALRDDPALEGRVVVKFVIGREGAVETASDAGSDMKSDVRDCVVRRFGDLSFPQPSGGIVTVVYPLVLTPT
ncbi:MAG TPA: AgmX/PglI C-terminal domain-containing protein [Polyangiaceae bacterium]|jgi:hypothetical protein|nr:AgmX/PglI C-terminal domain-containing protein [Polyangiaceae bacterium]